MSEMSYEEWVNLIKDMNKDQPSLLELVEEQVKRNEKDRE